MLIGRCSSQLSGHGKLKVTASERSASPIDRVTQRLWRGVEGPRRCLIYTCCWELFDHRSPKMQLWLPDKWEVVAVRSHRNQSRRDG